jgi:glucokinase
MILAGDIGGTNSRLALFDDDLTLRLDRTYASQEHPGLAPIVRSFLHDAGARVDRACFGIAGPVKLGGVKGTNLAWTVDAGALAAETGIAWVRLMNDLEAKARGVAMLRPSDVLTLNAGDPDPHGAAAVIAAGTGLGEAGLHWDGRVHQPYPSEGGHSDFAPRTDLEIELLQWLRPQVGVVSWEHVLSGRGLFNLYRFLRDTGRGDEPAWLRDALKAGDPPKVVSGMALDGRSALCAAAVDLFATLYGAEAGNLALKMLATAGVYLGGGIAPNIAPRLQSGLFMAAFVAKDRMQPLLASIPVHVILNQATALYGAARFASLATQDA